MKPAWQIIQDVVEYQSGIETGRNRVFNFFDNVLVTLNSTTAEEVEEEAQDCLEAVELEYGVNSWEYTVSHNGILFSRTKDFLRKRTRGMKPRRS